MEDSCLHHASRPTVAAASGISIFLLEELGDARLRAAQLKKYLDEAVELIDKSEHREHFFEVAGHLLYGIPDTLIRMDKALSAAAMAAAKLDFEEIKDDLQPEKVEALERALEEVRVRRVKRRSKEARSMDGLTMGKALEAFRAVVLPHLQHETREALDEAVADAMIEFARMRAGNHSIFSGRLEHFKPMPELDASEWIDQVEESMEMWFKTIKKTLSVKLAETTTMKIPEAIAQMERLAADIEASGTVDSTALSNLIVQLEGPSVKTATATREIAGVLRSLSASLLDMSDPAVRPSRLALASTLRRLLGDTANLKTAGFNLQRREAPATVGQKTMANSIPVVIATDAKTSDDTKESKFEEGKPADPTKNMSPAEAKEWKQNTEEHKDDFKAASGDMVSEEAKRSRFEEGKPADPTKNMDSDDAKKWKQETDAHKDEFKAASTDPWKVASDPWKVASGPSTSNWKELDGVYVGNSGSKHHWTWDGDDMGFIVTQIEGPGMPLYQLRMGATIDGQKTGRLLLRRPAQFKKQDDAFKAAGQWYRTIKDYNDNPGRGGGLDLSRDWVKDRG